MAALRPLVAACLGLVLAMFAVAPARAADQTPAAPAPPGPSPPGTPGLPPPAGPRSWVLVDADTGNVINAADDHRPMRPASLSKVLTAIIAARRLPPDAAIPVSPVAQGAEPVIFGMKWGQVYAFADALRIMLLLSANDAAVALSEAISGSPQGYAAEMQRAGAALHLADDPVLRDPAGLDDQFAVAGGNYISAYDMAIIGRAALAIPEIRQVVALPQYQFTAPDGVVHLIHNVDLGLQLYPGAIGIKTGYTKAAGNTIMEAAARGGRTMIAVVLQSPDAYRTGADLLDMGFATPVAAESGVDHLPRVSLPPASAAVAPPPRSAPGAVGRLSVTPPHSVGLLDGTQRLASVAAAGAVLVLALVAIVAHRLSVRRRPFGLGRWRRRRN